MVHHLTRHLLKEEEKLVPTELLLLVLALLPSTFSPSLFRSGAPESLSKTRRVRTSGAINSSTQMMSAPRMSRGKGGEDVAVGKIVLTDAAAVAAAVASAGMVLLLGSFSFAS